MENSPEIKNSIIQNQEIKKPEVNHRRLYGQFNREIVGRMKSLGMEIDEEPYDLEKVLEYLKDEKLRNEKKLEDRNAMKAEMFNEWILKNNISI